MSARHLPRGSNRAGRLVVSTLRGTPLLALAALMGCSGGTSSHPPSRTPIPACRTAQLHGSFGRLDAGAGQRYVPLVLTNVAKAPCSITGYPTVQLVAGNGQDIPTRMVHVDTGTIHRLTIAPRHRVSSVLHWAGIPLSDEAQTGPCEPTPARADITPPSEGQPLPLRWSLDAVCGHGQIDARPLQAGLPSR